MEIVARRGIRKGEEVVVSFGPRSNDNLLLFYGERRNGKPDGTCLGLRHFANAPNIPQ